MKVQIRRGVFETNSSTVHSMTMCRSDEWNDWLNGKTMYMPDKQKFLPTKEAEDYNCQLAEKEGTDFSDPYSVYWGCFYLSYENYVEFFCDNYNYDTFKGEKDGIVAFGYYGYDC